MKNIAIVFAVYILLMTSYLYPDAFSQNKKIGRGINMGNMLEAPAEGDWGAMLDDNYFPIIAEKGFNSVRIPIRWSAAGRADETAPFKVKEDFFVRVDTAINSALKNKLMVVINCHHYDELIKNPEGQWTRFISIWEQISDRYKDYPVDLIFEILNEPNGKLNSEKWNRLFNEVLKVIREKNPERIVIIGTAEWGGVSSLNKLILPKNDKNLILTVHYYNPFQFTHQEAEWVKGSSAWKCTRWEGTYYEKSAIIDDMEKTSRFSRDNNIPVFVGEFGAYSKADTASRIRWTSYCSRLFEKMGFSWAYWEFCSGFGIYDAKTQKWNKELLSALISNDFSMLDICGPEKPEDKPIGKDVLINGDFSNNDSSWIFGVWSGKATQTIEDGAFRVEIRDPGTDNWNIQLIQSGLILTDGARYFCSFDAWASQDRSISVSIENAINYTLYAGLSNQKIITEKKTYCFQFTKKGTDTNSRICFSFGTNKAGVFIDNVKLIKLDK